MSLRQFGFSTGHWIVTALCILITTLVAPHSVQAQIPTPTPLPGTVVPEIPQWTAPIAFGRTGWFPDIAADASGRLHVAWSNSVIQVVKGTTIREGFDIVLYSTSADGGKTWSPDNEVVALKEGVAGNAEVTRPSMAISSSGILHMTFRDMNVQYANVSAQAASEAQYWTKTQQVTNYMGYFSKVAIDSQGRVHMFYTENVITSDCMACLHLFYRYSDDGGVTWASGVDVSVLPTGAAKPNVLIDRQDNIHVVWESGRGGTLGTVSDPTTVMYAVSYNRGETWSQPLTITNETSERARNITIGQDGAGNIVMAWWGLPEDLVYYQVSADNGLSWSKPAQIPNVWGVWFVYTSRLDTYSMATDSAGYLHLVMVGRTAAAETTMRLLHLIWDGSTWSFPEAIVSYQGDAPEWPRVAVSNGNQLNVVWFVRGEDFIWSAGGEAYKVWYSSKKLDTPPIRPVEFPQPVLPTIVLRDTPVVIETPTPLPVRPTLEGAENIVIAEDTVSTEAQQLTVLVRSLVPAVLLVGLLLIGIVIRKR